MAESANQENTLVGAPWAVKGILQRGFLNAGCSVVGTAFFAPNDPAVHWGFSRRYEEGGWIRVMKDTNPRFSASK
jgi:hypothetical protein